MTGAVNVPVALHLLVWHCLQQAVLRLQTRAKMGDEINDQRNSAKTPAPQPGPRLKTQAKMGDENNHQRHRARIPNPQPYDESAKDLRYLKNGLTDSEPIPGKIMSSWSSSNKGCSTKYQSYHI